jgi:hypothetical protein
MERKSTERCIAMSAEVAEARRKGLSTAAVISNRGRERE